MRVLSAVLLLIVLSACTAAAPVMQVDVLRHHRWEPGRVRQVMILPHADQAQDAEFARTADLIAGELAGQGLTRAAAPGPETAVLRFRWTIEPAKTETVLSPSAAPPFGVQYRAARRIDPFPYWTASKIVYVPKRLTATLVDSTDAVAAPLFEGSAVTLRGGSDMAPVMPYLVQGMFDGFPGPSGVLEKKALPLR